MQAAKYSVKFAMNVDIEVHFIVYCRCKEVPVVAVQLGGQSNKIMCCSEGCNRHG
jgi:hypothetical protein